AGGLEQVQDLFLELADDADQLDAPVVYAIAKEGRAGLDPDHLEPTLEPLFQAILEHVPPPSIEEGAFQMLVANRGHDDYTGTLAIGRIFRGSVAPRHPLTVLGAAGGPRPARGGQVLAHRGRARRAAARGGSGDT